MSPRLRITLLVAAAAAAAAGVTVAATALTSDEAGGRRAIPSAPRPRPGAPPLLLDLGVRTDRDARSLRRAAALYDRGSRLDAGRLLGEHRSLEARVGAALAAWPGGFAAVERLAADHPRSALVQLHLGLALYWMGRTGEARVAWRRAKEAQPDSLYAVRAADLLHPDYVPGLPTFVPSFRPPRGLAGVLPPRQYALLAERARSGGVRDKLLYGVALQRLGRPRSAEREFAAAAALAPDDPEAQVAAAVGRFDKDAPQRAFSRLGPLTRTYPKASTVRFHLGLLLLWLGQVEEAKRQLRLARATAPSSPLGREADRFLERLEAAGTGSRER